MMKKAIAVMVLLALVGTPVFAEPIHDVVGAKLDAPNLIGLKQISPDLHLGMEVSKDLASNLFYPDSYKGIEDDLGYAIYAKVTFDGCLINCNK